MPNRKEPRLEMEEQQPVANPASDTDDQPQAFVESSAPSSAQKTSVEPPPVNKAPVGSSKGSSKGSSGKAWLGIFLALIALGLLAWQFLQLQHATQQMVQQQQSMQLLGNRIQELEGVLSTTGDDLSAAGNSFNEKLKLAMSEIDKLWGVAYRTNRPAIQGLDTKTKQLEQGLSKVEKQLAEALETNKTVAIASKAATEKSLELAEDLKKYNATLKINADEMNLQIKGLTQRLTEVSLTASTLDERLRNQDLRIGLAALEKRVTELASKTPNIQSQPDELQAKLVDKLTAQVAEQQEILASLEASRGQLVGRVTRLMEEVRALQQAR